MKNTKMAFSRRDVLKAAGAGAAVTAFAGCATTGGGRLGRVVVIGGGFGGSTAAKYIRMWSEGEIAVTMIERNANFISCPMSNLVIGGVRKMEEITRGYDTLKDKYGVDVVQGEVTTVDPVKKLVMLADGRSVPYDRLVMAPGIDFRFDTVQGHSEAATEKVPHAWKAGPQTVNLRKQLEAMPDGGVFVMSIPKAPYRCPPGPYERMCVVADYFKQAKPKSKVIVLDANPEIQSKKPLFTKVIETQYKDIVSYQPNMNVNELNLAGMSVTTELGETVKASVLNVIPSHGAASLAHKTGLVNKNKLWCGVDWVTMESEVHKGIHVIGDATFPAPLMPKSGHMANQHAKAAAAAIVEMMNGRQPIAPMMANTCYSYVDAKNVVHVASVHTYNAQEKTMKTVAGAGGISVSPSSLEGSFAWSWANNIWADMLA